MIFRPLVIQYSNYFTDFKKSIKQYYGLQSLRNLLFIKPDKKLYYQDNLETEFCISHPGWSQMQDTPAEFPPEEHTHNYADPAHVHADYAATGHAHNYAASVHTHNYADPVHVHDDRYYTESEITTSLAGKSNTGHTHNYADPAHVHARIIGEMVIWPTNTPPDDWLLCAGQAVSRSTYSGLFGVIGTTFGVGNGSTTFNLPDLRGRVPLGQDDMGGSSANRVTAAAADGIGGSGGAETHTLTTAELAAHNHGVYARSGGAGSVWSVDTINTQTGALDNYYSSSQGGGSPHNNMPPWLAINFIIYAGA